LDIKEKRDYINNIPKFKGPQLDINNTNIVTWNSKKSKPRRKDFNYLESKAIVYITKDNLQKLINNEKVPLPKDIMDLFEDKFYPKLYFATSDRLKISETFNE
jgi:hypothetical protein